MTAPIEGRIVTEGEQIRPIHSPDCRDGNCYKCNGSAWDLAADQTTECGCDCHHDAAAAMIAQGMGAVAGILGY